MVGILEVQISWKKFSVSKTLKCFSFLVLHLAWNSAFYDIALPCKQPYLRCSWLTLCIMLILFLQNCFIIDKWDKVFKSGLSTFFKGCLPQNVLSPLLNTSSQMRFCVVSHLSLISLRPETLFKRDSSTGVFLSILRNF